MNNKKNVPFYTGVSCTKLIGGKRPLWHAHKPGINLCGAGNTAENAIKDLQAQLKAGKNLDRSLDLTA